MSKTLKTSLTGLQKKKERAEIIHSFDEFTRNKNEAMTVAKLMSLCECEQGDGEEATMQEVGYLMVEKLEEMEKCIHHLQEQLSLR